METHGQTVRLFLVDGTPTGITTAEIMNWTGHLLASPRSKLPEALSREEATRTGIYLLIGDDPEVAGRQRLYVGEGDSVADRIKMHAKDPAKDFWTRCYLISSKDHNLTKAHVRYLESRVVQIARASGRAVLANGNEPSPKQLPESDIADMEFFLRQVQLILPVVGVDALRPKPSKPTVSGELSIGTSDEDEDLLELYLESKKHGIEAQAIELDGEITILEGSTATKKDDFSMNQYSTVRDALIADGTLVEGDDPQVLFFTRDASFGSPSAAAAVLYNRNSNGRTSWKIKGTNLTLKEWQDAQLEQVE